jgi:hypothetical protein
MASVRLRALKTPDVVQVGVGSIFATPDGIPGEITDSSVASANLTGTDSSNGVVVLPGDAFSSAATFLQLNLIVSVTVNGTTSMCSATLDIDLFEADTCINQLPPLLGVIVRLSSVTIILNAPLSMVSGRSPCILLGWFSQQ